MVKEEIHTKKIHKKSIIKKKKNTKMWIRLHTHPSTYQADLGIPD